MSVNKDIKTYTKDQVREMASKNPDKIYLSIEKNVYDVTPFLKKVRAL